MLIGTAFYVLTQMLYQYSNTCSFLKLLERCKNIDVDDYNRMKDDVQQMQVG